MQPFFRKDGVRFLADHDFVVKLPVGMDLNEDAAQDLSKQIDDISSRLPELEIKIKSEGAKKITKEIDYLVSALSKSGRTDFRVDILGDQSADIRKVAVQYNEVADSIKKVIKQEYTLRDVTEEGAVVQQVWTEGSKAVVKYSQGLDEAKTNAEANKRAMEGLAAEIASVNKYMAQSELALARGNQASSDFYFNKAAAGELAAQDKIIALEKEGIISYEQAAQKLYELDTALSQASEKADIFKASLIDKQSAAQTKAALSEIEAEIKSMTKAMSLSEEEFVRGNYATSSHYFSQAAASEARAIKKIEEGESSGEIPFEAAIEQLDKLDAALASSSQKADLLNAKLRDKARLEAEAAAKEYDQYITKELLTDVTEYANLLRKINQAENEGRMGDAGAARYEMSQREAAIQQKINQYREQGLLTQTSAEVVQREMIERVRATADEMARFNSLMKNSSTSDRINEELRERAELLRKNLELAEEFESETAAFMKSDSRLEKSSYFSSEVKKLEEGLRAGSITGEQARRTLSKLKSEARAVGLAGKTMGVQIVDGLKDLANVATVAESIRTLFEATKRVVENVRELDDAMVDLQIASGATADEVGRMMDGYHDLAKSLGATSVEVAQAADGWLNKIGLPYRNMRLQFS